MHRSGKDVFDMAKDLEVIFGKGPGSQLLAIDNDGFRRQRSAWFHEM